MPYAPSHLSTLPFQNGQFTDLQGTGILHSQSHSLLIAVTELWTGAREIKRKRKSHKLVMTGCAKT